MSNPEEIRNGLYHLIGKLESIHRIAVSIMTEGDEVTASLERVITQLVEVKTLILTLKEKLWEFRPKLEYIIGSSTSVEALQAQAAFAHADRAVIEAQKLVSNEVNTLRLVIQLLEGKTADKYTEIANAIVTGIDDLEAYISGL